MKQWYCLETKHFINRLLDFYQEKNEVIHKYANIININKSHWIVLVVEVSGKKKLLSPEFIP